MSNSNAPDHSTINNLEEFPSKKGRVIQAQIKFGTTFAFADESFLDEPQSSLVQFRAGGSPSAMFSPDAPTMNFDSDSDILYLTMDPDSRQEYDCFVLAYEEEIKRIKFMAVPLGNPAASPPAGKLTSDLNYRHRVRFEQIFAGRCPKLERLFLVLPTREHFQKALRFKRTELCKQIDSSEQWGWPGLRGEVLCVEPVVLDEPTRIIP